MQALAERYREPSDLPSQVAVFPLRRVILLPRATLPLNVFEPRYLAMIDDALSGSRLLAMVQPSTPGTSESPPGRTEPLRRIGCLGRLTSFQEEEGRMLVTLTGISRCALEEEVAADKPYRVWRISCEAFADDLVDGSGEEEVDRQQLLATFKSYLDAHGLKADWSAISQSSNEQLVNALSMMSPYGPEEKQALLEAADLKTRAEVLVALAQMELASGSGSAGSTLQ